MKPTPNINRIIACRGDDEPLVERVGGAIEMLSDIEIYGRFSASAAPVTRELKAGGGDDSNAHRLELIQQLRNNQHLELVVKRARVFKQSMSPGKMRNRNSLRFLGSQLASIAPTWKGQPFLVDHNAYEQAARKGTILTSELGEHQGSPAFFQGFSVVKPDAAISVLDGTIDRFSIGWFPLSAVMCTVHKVDVRGKDSCYCWPGETVEVDGKAQIVEYEYQDAEGKELSSVNVPAVKGTKIEEFHAALAAELDFSPTRPKERKMKFHRLAVALGLSALDEADEDRALTAVEALSRRATTAEQELATSRRDLGAAQAQLAAAQTGIQAAGKIRIDGIISAATAAGKIKAVRNAAGEPVMSAKETRLRRIAAEPGGIAQLEAEIAELDVIVPVGQRLQIEEVEAPKRTTIAAVKDGALANAMQAIADQLGIKVEDMVKFQDAYNQEGV
jgi:hypothetical protein